MHSSGDFYDDPFLLDNDRSRPPSIHSASLKSDRDPFSLSSNDRGGSEDVQPPCSYYFDADVLLCQPSAVNEGRRDSMPLRPVVEDDDDDGDGDWTNGDRCGNRNARGTAFSTDGHGMPVLKEEDLGQQNEEVGRGGDRGARVYKIQLEHIPRPTAALRELLRRANAHKVYQSVVSADEASFTCVAAHAEAAINAVGATNRCATLHRGMRHLVVPAAFVSNASQERKGLLVPLFDCSLAQFLMKRDAYQKQPDHGGDNFKAGGPTLLLPNDDGVRSAFLARQRYTHIASPSVVAAIGYQLLSAVATLNDELPHETVDKTGERLACTGYSHNDIYIDNVLLSEKEGRVALCDFELVGHLPKNPRRSDMSRFPPPSRTSPLGFFSRTADTWSFALLLIGLLTGVDPLLSNEPLTDDFGDGPLLLPFDSPDRDPRVDVLDWEANVRTHVYRLFDALDYTPTMMKEVEPLMDVCAHCLANNGNVKPLSATELLKLPLFDRFRDSDALAESIVRQWVSTA